MNRIDRVTAILIQLQSKKVIKAQEIAERFHISLRTVYRDIKTLEQAGIPILGEAGVGYSIMDGYRLPPVMFTKEEAIAFLTAEKLIEKFVDSSTESSYKAAMYKVRAVLRSSEKDMLENMEEQIEVMRKYAPFQAGSNTNTLQTLLKSISEKEVLCIRYHAFNSDEITERSIEPIGIFYASGYWHTIAFCRLRNDYRDFRADRILQIRATETRWDRKHPSLKTYLKEIAEKQNLQTVVINVKKETARHLDNNKYYYGFVKEKVVKDQMQMTFLVPCPYSFLRWYLMFADEAEIVSPESLDVLLREYVDRISRKIYGGSTLAVTGDMKAFQ
jgi:predicted DNA-binding transcriptional regulator YafY